MRISFKGFSETLIFISHFLSNRANILKFTIVKIFLHKQLYYLIKPTISHLLFVYLQCL